MKQTSISDDIQDLRAMEVPILVARYEEVFGKAPRVKHRDWLWRRIAWKIQEERLGGLSSVAKKRLDELIGEIDFPVQEENTMKGTIHRRSTGTDPVVGTTLTRRWRGQDIHATRTDQGWEHDGVHYRSLSALAKAVTGSHLSGPAWFGLTKRRVQR